MDTIEDYAQNLKNAGEDELVDWLTEVELVLSEFSRISQCLRTLDRIGQTTVPSIIRTRGSLFYLNSHYLERLDEPRKGFDNLGAKD